LPQQRVLPAAQLGQELIRLEPGFKAGVLGDRSLKVLLQRYPDIGTWREEGGGHFEFSAVQSGPRAPETARLYSEAWRAFTAPSNALCEYFIDLAMRRLLRRKAEAIGTTTDTIAAEPERYLPVEPVSDEVLRACAASFIEALPAGIDRTPFTEALASSSWRTTFRQMAAAAKVGNEWQKVHQACVVAHARAWAEAHRIPFDRLTSSVSPRRNAPEAHTEATSRAAAKIAPDADLTAIRAMVHAAVDRMSSEELLDLRIPLRHLLAHR
jgi:hypothetical protein